MELPPSRCRSGLDRRPVVLHFGGMRRDLRQVVSRLLIIWLQAQRGLIFGYRFRHVFGSCSESGGQIVMRDGRIGKRLQSRLIMRDRLWHVSGFCQRVAVVGFDVRGVGFDLEGGLILLDCLREAPVLSQCYAEIMMGEIVAAGDDERMTKECFAVPPILDLCFA